LIPFNLIELVPLFSDIYRASWSGMLENYFTLRFFGNFYSFYF
jgi:hypothetical protein